MPVDLKFYTENTMELNEINAGQVRMNYGTITPIKIQNAGQDKARRVIIAANALNTIEELTQSLGSSTAATQEYNKQLKAASWKTFSLNKDGPYVESLELGNINANSFLEGEQIIKESFSNKERCIFQDVWSYCLETMGDNALKIYKNESKSQTAQRKTINFGEKRDIEITFKLNYERQVADYSNGKNCLVIFPVRINNYGLGYILSFQLRASDGKLFFGIYKNGKGMIDNLNRVYGTRIIDTNGLNHMIPIN